MCSRHTAVPNSGPSQLTDRRSILNTAFAPQGIQTTGDLERAGLTNVALKHLSIVAHLFDNAGSPGIAEIKTLALDAFLAEETTDIGDPCWKPPSYPRSWR